MAISKLTLDNFTVFEKIDFEFSSGINVFIGENGTGKTHVMKVLYSACQAVRADISFSHKLVKVFKPDDLNISRLARRKVGGTNTNLFWDEPEANINPIHIPVIVEMLLELQKNGIQIFISTHDYILAKYFEVKRRKDNEVMFFSLYKSDNGVNCEKNKYFKDLKENPIVEAFDKLLDEVYDK